MMDSQAFQRWRANGNVAGALHLQFAWLLQGDLWRQGPTEIVADLKHGRNIRIRPDSS